MSSRPFSLENRDVKGSLNLTVSSIDSSSILIYGGLLNIKSNEFSAMGSSQSAQISSMLFFLHNFKFFFATLIASE